MQYDYSGGGLKMDVAGIMRYRNEKKQIENAERAAEQMREDAKAYREVYAKYQKDRNPEDLRKMFALNPEDSKLVYEMEKDLDDEQRKSLGDTVNEMAYYVDNGDPNVARQIILEREGGLKQFGSSTKYTTPLAEAARTMDDEQFADAVRDSYNVATRTGLIEEPDREGWENEGTFFNAAGQQYIKFRKPDNTFVTELTGDTREAIEAREIEEARAGAGDKLSPPLGNYRISLEELAAESRSKASDASRLMQGYDEAIAEGIDPNRKGLVGNVYDKILGVVGAQDPLTMLRTKGEKLLSKEVVSLLPKGAASDRDVALMQKAVPDAYTNPTEFRRWLETYQRLSTLAAEGAELKTVWVEQTRSARSAARSANIRGVEIKRGDEFGDFYKKYLKRMSEQEEKERKRMQKVQQREQDLEDAIGGTGGASSGVIDFNDL